MTRLDGVWKGILFQQQIRQTVRYVQEHCEIAPKIRERTWCEFQFWIWILIPNKKLLVALEEKRKIFFVRNRFCYDLFVQPPMRAS